MAYKNKTLQYKIHIKKLKHSENTRVSINIKSLSIQFSLHSSILYRKPARTGLGGQLKGGSSTTRVGFRQGSLRKILRSSRKLYNKAVLPISWSKTILSFIGNNQYLELDLRELSETNAVPIKRGPHANI